MNLQTGNYLPIDWAKVDVTHDDDDDDNDVSIHCRWFWFWGRDVRTTLQKYLHIL